MKFDFIKPNSNRKINLLAFFIMSFFSVCSYFLFIKSSDIIFHVITAGFLFIFTIGALLFLTIVFFKDNKFFNFLLLILLTPLILLFSIIINVYYFIFVPGLVLFIMAVLVFILYILTGLLLMSLGVDGNNKAILYVCTIIVILLYYYFGDRLFKSLNSFVYKLAANEYSKKRRIWLDKTFNPDTNRKSLYLLLLLVYIVVKVSYFADYEPLFRLEFINEALLTFVIFDTLVSGKNSIGNLLKSNSSKSKKNHEQT
ncbi:hypothetical protein P4H61_16610 [Paenibacillus peoriae]|uniref:hypothetical protein n=1 Tax=Paenibacillus peoriae TaxID=59893 RepID=UPI00026C6169|nr:hypothetical protein [Paenibacillus peoriae]MEC0183109.1 hypothetical protein [Paenibacillus peoriae]